MLFNSFEFLLFLPIVFCLYWFVFNKSLRWQNILILAASYFFYGWWSKKFLALLALSTLLDYSYGFWVASPNKKKAKLFLWLSIINNLGILGVFKYYNFFATQVQTAFESIGIHTNPTLLHVALPIGISFYTFHGMSYVFDIYRGHQKPVSNFIDYAVFVSFFPLLVAGPIERANHLLPQVQKKRTFRYVQSVEGLRLILWGMFKKVVIADSLAVTVDSIFNNYQEVNGITLIFGAIAFSFQIYCDFSGYSDIALGTAKIFGFELLSNFKFPYFSRDIAEFWRRWHVSLSSWFRDYLYIPLGGSRDGKSKAVRNTFVIFLVSGFWHGASWNFIAWGFIHACGFLPLLLLNRNRKHLSNVVAQDHKLPNLKELWQMLSTFAFVTFAWIFFRASDMTLAVNYIKNIFVSIAGAPGQITSLPDGYEAVIYIVPLIIGDWWLRRNERQLRSFNNKYLRWAFYLVLMLILVYKSMDLDNTTFIYFQF
ncbi:MAG: MBOAT family protein [Chitinophagaceae bacterium]|nr:MBOAT family protein [Chitinophagaceae bacterium]MCB9046219.1 MBOAT family protein [Chitinophagales bacterium]